MDTIEKSSYEKSSIFQIKNIINELELHLAQEKSQIDNLINV